MNDRYDGKHSLIYPSADLVRQIVEHLSSGYGRLYDPQLSASMLARSDQALIMPEGVLVVDGYRRVLSVAGLSTESHSRQDALTHVFQTALTLDMLEFCTVSEGANKVQSALAAAGMVRVNDTNTVRRLFSQYSAGGPNYTSDRDGNLLTVNTPNTQRVGYRQQVWSVPDHHRDS